MKALGAAPSSFILHPSYFPPSPPSPPTFPLLPPYTSLVLNIAGPDYDYPSVVFVVLQDYLSSVTTNWQSLIGLMFVVVVLFFPRGLLGFLQRKSQA